MGSFGAFLLVSGIIATPYLILRYINHGSDSRLMKIANIFFLSAELMLVIAALEIAPDYDGYPLIITVYGSFIISSFGLISTLFNAERRAVLKSKIDQVKNLPVLGMVWRALGALLTFTVVFFYNLVKNVAKDVASEPVESAVPNAAKPRSMGEDHWRLNNIPGAAGYYDEKGKYRRSDESPLDYIPK